MNKKVNTCRFFSAEKAPEDTEWTLLCCKWSIRSDVIWTKTDVSMDDSWAKCYKTFLLP